MTEQSNTKWGMAGKAVVMQKKGARSKLKYELKSVLLLLKTPQK